MFPGGSIAAIAPSDADSRGRHRKEALARLDTLQRKDWQVYRLFVILSF